SSHLSLVSPLLPFYFYRAHLYLHSFPTRRSSDLALHTVAEERAALDAVGQLARAAPSRSGPRRRLYRSNRRGYATPLRSSLPPRSEEHTSELQSLAYLVCRLLLEKKKKKTTQLIY